MEKKKFRFGRGSIFSNASWKKSQNQLTRFGANLWKRRCMRFRRRMWHGAGNILSNCRSWQERREMFFRLVNTEGKNKEYETCGVENDFFFKGLESRLCAIWKCCSKLVVSISSTFSAQAGIHVWYEHCKSLSVAFSTWAMKDQCESYCTLSPTPRWEKVILFPK